MIKRLLFVLCSLALLMGANPAFAQSANATAISTLPTISSNQTTGLFTDLNGRLVTAAGGTVSNGTPVLTAGTPSQIYMDTAGRLFVNNTQNLPSGFNSSAPFSTSAVASSLVVKTGTVSFTHIDVVSGASAGFVMVFNATSAPADGAVTPTLCYSLAANSTFSQSYTGFEKFTTGLTIVFSTTGCFSKTASATAFIAAMAN
jgi:hypothetical protein